MKPSSQATGWLPVIQLQAMGGFGLDDDDPEASSAKLESFDHRITNLKLGCKPFRGYQIRGLNLRLLICGAAF